MREPDAAERAAERREMVRRIDELVLETAAMTGIAKLDARVREALLKLPRHRFVPDESVARAYVDGALSIGCGQTISQPFIVALMTQLAGVSEASNVLEVGTGSGYQAAVLAQLSRRVHTLEIVPELAQRASALLRELGLDDVEVRCGDGAAGWPERAPFDAILVTAATPVAPPALLAQLAPGGRMVVPLGEPFASQDLASIVKHADGTLEVARRLPVAFVPLTGPLARAAREG